MKQDWDASTRDAGAEDGDTWDPEAYAQDARFVSKLATSVFQRLNPQPGEHIPDLGCGDGVLSRQIADVGCTVVGVDSRPRQHCGGSSCIEKGPG